MVSTLIGHSQLRIRRLPASVKTGLMALMVIAFLGSRPTVETPLFYEVFGRDPDLRFYWLVFIPAVVLNLGYLAVISTWYSRHDTRWLSSGLRMIGIGCAALTMFLVSRVAAMFVDLGPLVESLAALCLMLGGILVGLGALIPRQGALGGAALGRARLWCRLLPHWRATTMHYPYVRRHRRFPRTLESLVAEVQDAVVIARERGELSSPLWRALDEVLRLPVTNFYAVVTEPERLAARSTSGRFRKTVSA